MNKPIRKASAAAAFFCLALAGADERVIRRGLGDLAEQDGPGGGQRAVEDAEGVGGGIPLVGGEEPGEKREQELVLAAGRLAERLLELVRAVAKLRCQPADDRGAPDGAERGEPGVSELLVGMRLEEGELAPPRKGVGWGARSA